MFSSVVGTADRTKRTSYSHALVFTVPLAACERPSHCGQQRSRATGAAKMAMLRLHVATTLRTSLMVDVPAGDTVVQLLGV